MISSPQQIMVTPATLDFGTLARGQRQVRSITIQNLGDEPVHFSVTCDDPPTWFDVIRTEKFDQATLFPLRVVIAVNTEFLTPGHHYETELVIQMDERIVEVPISVRIREGERTPVVAATQARRWRWWSLGLGVALVLLAALYIFPTERLASLRSRFVWLQPLRQPAVAEDWMVFTVNDGELPMLHALTTADSRPRTLGLVGRHPAIAPDGRQIAYIAQVDGTWQVHLARFADLVPYQISEGSASKADPQWSPDGKRLAFASQEGNSVTVEVVDVPQWEGQSTASAIATVDSTFTTDLNAHLRTLSSVLYFSWMPDGQSLLVGQQTDNGQTLNQVSATAVDSFQFAEQGEVAWHPNHSAKAVGSPDQGILYFADELVDENAPPRILAAMPASRLTWSPLGSRLAFLSPGHTGTGQQNLWFVEINSGSVVQVTRDGCLHYAWSPDGTQLAFVTGQSNAQPPTLYLWTTTGNATPNLQAEINDVAIEWATVER